MSVRDDVIEFLVDEYNVDKNEAINLVDKYTKDNPEDILDPETEIEILAESVYTYDEDWSA